MASTRFLLSILLSILLTGPLNAQSHTTLELPPIFADHAVLQRDQPIVTHGYAAPNQNVSVTFDSVTVTVQADKAGLWIANFPAHPAGGPYTLDILAGNKHLHLKDILLGDVWLASGQSNMSFEMQPFLPWTEGVLNFPQEIAQANNPTLRFFTVPLEAAYPEKPEADGTWQVVTPSSACHLSAVAYYFAQEVSKQTGVPIGILSASVGSTAITSWMASSRIEASRVLHNQEEREQHKSEIADYEQALPAYFAEARRDLNACGKHAEYKQPFPGFLFKGSGCYNAMISPLRTVAIKGVIWYQGEGDSSNHVGYADRMRSLIEGWRSNWHNPDLPFYYVQLANLDQRPQNAAKKDFKPGNFAALRQEQFLAQSIPHTGMAVTADVGDPMFIHPRDKKTVGQRLAFQALLKTYGKNIAADGPLYTSYSVDGDKMILHFVTNGFPLLNRTGSSKPGGFEIAGDDGVFVPALTTLQGDTVILTSPAVPSPKHARYAFEDDPRLSLYNSAGLPSSPFETK